MEVMLAKPYADQQIDGWHLSEKLDGVRALWDGATLKSRNGNTFAAPDWFLFQLPADTPLDGELYIGRGQFQATASVVRKQTPVDAEWQQITYMVFDAPSTPGSFEARLERVRSVLSGNTVAMPVPHTVCTGKAHLDSVFSEITAAGSEGVMLRRPGSAYEPKRSASLLKYKPFESDEATVTGHVAGTGRIAGVLGALVCSWQGKTFKVGTGLDDATRIDPPAIDAQITFGFCGLTDAGLPRFPTFIAVRDYE